MSTLMNAIKNSHEYVSKVVNMGDVVVDATCGNGHDTQFLASLVGEKGRVYAFDIQEIAIKKSKKKIRDLGLKTHVEFILDGHEKLDDYVSDTVKAVMFNLGYLPGGDHACATNPESSICGIRKAIELIEIGGLVSIVVYHGGDSGDIEKDEVLKFVKTIDQKRYTVMKIEYMNQLNNPPILVCIERNN